MRMIKMSFSTNIVRGLFAKTANIEVSAWDYISVSWPYARWAVGFGWKQTAGRGASFKIALKAEESD
jgi:hypothetical protein